MIQVTIGMPTISLTNLDFLKPECTIENSYIREQGDVNINKFKKKKKGNQRWNSKFFEEKKNQHNTKVKQEWTLSRNLKT